MKTQVAKFNIGGRKYEVARTLLDSYPHTLLARSACKLWQEDTNDEIFIERDGDQFAYCLSYLRDHKCSLPWTISRDAILEDLKYYGLEDIDESSIEYDGTRSKDVSVQLRIVADVIKNLEETIAFKETDLADHKFILHSLGKLLPGSELSYTKNYSTIRDEFRVQMDEVIKKKLTPERETTYRNYGLIPKLYNLSMQVDRIGKSGS